MLNNTVPGLPPLLENDLGLAGYDAEVLADYMDDHWFGAAWREWCKGITGAMVDDDHLLVYRDDVERFLHGLPNID